MFSTGWVRKRFFCFSSRDEKIKTREWAVKPEEGLKMFGAGKVQTCVSAQQEAAPAQGTECLGEFFQESASVGESSPLASSGHPEACASALSIPKKHPLMQARNEHEMRMFHSWESKMFYSWESEFALVLLAEGRANGVLVQDVGDSMRMEVMVTKLMFASNANNVVIFDIVPKGLMGTEMRSLEVKQGGLSAYGPNDIISNDEDEDFLWDPG